MLYRCFILLLPHLLIRTNYHHHSHVTIVVHFPLFLFPLLCFIFVSLLFWNCFSSWFFLKPWLVFYPSYCPVVLEGHKRERGPRSARQLDRTCALPNSLCQAEINYLHFHEMLKMAPSATTATKQESKKMSYRPKENHPQ